MQSNAAAFNASSPRQSLGSPAHESGPTPRRRSVSPFDNSGSSPRSADGAVLASSPRSVSSNRSFGPGGAGMPGSVAMNRALISNEGGETVETLLAEPSEGLQVRTSETEPVSPLSLAVPDPINAAPAEPFFAATTSNPPAPGLNANGLPQPAPRSRSPLPSGSSSSNPFFGSSGVTRERLSKSAASAQSGSGKVISGLQSDLLQARSALESTRGQLRLSQRAVEHLGRQTGEFCESGLNRNEPSAHLALGGGGTQRT